MHLGYVGFAMGKYICVGFYARPENGFVEWHATKYATEGVREEGVGQGGAFVSVPPVATVA